MAVNTVFNGGALVPFFPVCIGLAAEITFPIQEAVIVGTLQMVGHLGGMSIGFSGVSMFKIDAVSPLRQTQLVWGLFLFLCILSGILSVFIKEDLKRIKYAKETENE